MLFFTKKPAREEPWTTQVWFYDLRTNKHFTLKRNKLTRDDLQEFIDAYNPEDPTAREESERFCAYDYETLVARDQVNLHITWLKDDAHVDVDDLPPPDVLAAEIVEDLEAALSELRELAEEFASTATDS